MLRKSSLTFRGIDDAQWAAAVEHLRTKLEEKDRQRIAREIGREGLVEWTGRHHFLLGLTVRNILRRGGFTEETLGVFDLDMAWGHLVSEAVGLPPLD